MCLGWFSLRRDELGLGFYELRQAWRFGVRDSDWKI